MEAGGNKPNNENHAVWLKRQEILERQQQKQQKQEIPKQNQQQSMTVLAADMILTRNIIPADGCSSSSSSSHMETDKVDSKRLANPVMVTSNSSITGNLFHGSEKRHGDDDEMMKLGKNNYNNMDQLGHKKNFDIGNNDGFSPTSHKRKKDACLFEDETKNNTVGHDGGNDDDDGDSHSNVTVLPGDVLLGLNKGLRNRPGNLQLRLLMDKHRKTYERSCRFEKTVITNVIIKTIQDQGGRFLKHKKGNHGVRATTDNNNHDDGQWEIIVDEEARKKVSHDYRNLRRKFVTPP